MALGKTYVTVSVFFALLFSFYGTAHSAQNPRRAQEQIIQQEEQRRRQLEQQYKESLETPPSGLEIQIPASPRPATKGRSFEVKQIEFKGVSLLTKEEIASLKSPYLNQCVTLNDVNDLIRYITETYIKKGYVTTRAILPQQDISTGILVIQVVEGKVEGIEFKDGKARAGELATAFPDVIGNALNLRDI